MDLFQQYIDEWVASYNRQEPNWQADVAQMDITPTEYLTFMFQEAVLADGMLQERIADAITKLEG